MARNSAAAAPSGAKRFAALRNRNFALLWSGLIVSNAGSWMQLVAQGWLVYDLTHSPFILGLVGVARAVPLIILPPFGGTIADRVPRLKLLKFTQLLSFALALPLAFLALINQVQVWEIVLLSFLGGAVNAFDQPTRQALLPDLVPKEDLTSAVALNSAAWQGSSLLGPTLAGATIATMGVAGAFFFNAFSFLAVVLALYVIRGVPERSAGSGNRRNLFSDVGLGLRYVVTVRPVLALILLSVVANVFGRSYQQLLPAFARDTLHQGSAGLGFMTSASGLGTLVAAIVLSAMGDVRRKSMILLVSMGAFGVIVGLFAVTRSFPIALALLTAAGVTNFAFSTMTMTILQIHVPNEMRGRVLSLLVVTAQGFAPLGSLVVGAASEAIGTSTAVAASAALVGIAALVTVIAMPGVRTYGDGVPAGAEASGVERASARS